MARAAFPGYCCISGQLEASSCWTRVLALPPSRWCALSTTRCEQSVGRNGQAGARCSQAFLPLQRHTALPRFALAGKSSYLPKARLRSCRSLKDGARAGDADAASQGGRGANTASSNIRNSAENAEPPQGGGEGGGIDDTLSLLNGLLSDRDAEAKAKQRDREAKYDFKKQKADKEKAESGLSSPTAQAPPLPSENASNTTVRPPRPDLPPPRTPPPPRGNIFGNMTSEEIRVAIDSLNKTLEEALAQRAKAEAEGKLPTTPSESTADPNADFPPFAPEPSLSSQLPSANAADLESLVGLDNILSSLILVEIFERCKEGTASPFPFFSLSSAIASSVVPTETLVEEDQGGGGSLDVLIDTLVATNMRAMAETGHYELFDPDMVTPQNVVVQEGLPRQPPSRADNRAADTANNSAMSIDVFGDANAGASGGDAKAAATADARSTTTADVTDIGPDGLYRGARGVADPALPSARTATAAAAASRESETAQGAVAQQPGEDWELQGQWTLLAAEQASLVDAGARKGEEGSTASREGQALAGPSARVGSPADASTTALQGNAMDASRNPSQSASQPTPPPPSPSQVSDGATQGEGEEAPGRWRATLNPAPFGPKEERGQAGAGSPLGDSDAANSGSRVGRNQAAVGRGAGEAGEERAAGAPGGRNTNSPPQAQGVVPPRGGVPTLPGMVPNLFTPTTLVETTSYTVNVTSVTQMRPTSAVLAGPLASLPVEVPVVTREVFRDDCFSMAENFVFSDALIFRGKVLTRKKGAVTRDKAAHNVEDVRQIMQDRLDAAYPSLSLKLFLLTDEEGEQLCLIILRGRETYEQLDTTTTRRLFSGFLILLSVWACTCVPTLPPLSLFGAELALGEPTSDPWGVAQMALGLSLVGAMAFGGRALACLRHGMNVLPPLPYPSPTYGLMGLLSAVPSSVPSRSAEVDVSLAGPLASLAASGLMFALAASGFQLDLLGGDGAVSELASVAGGVVGAGASSGAGLVYVPTDLLAHSRWLSALAQQFQIAVVKDDMGAGLSLFNPFAVAGLLGLNLSALMMLPAGPSDGSRVLQALFGRTVSSIVCVTLTLLVAYGALAEDVGIAKWWLFFFVVATNIEGPDRLKLDEVSEPGTFRAAAGVAAIVLSMCCLFSPW